MAERTRDALEIVERVIGEDEELRALIDEEMANAELARLIRDARVRAGLSQRDLAERIGSTQPTISRLEDAGYEGHSLTTLRRIAAALGLRIEIRLCASVEAPTD
jgi:ribosome-binding protein aMBF1 (putative translation factor)